MKDRQLHWPLTQLTIQCIEYFAISLTLCVCIKRRMQLYIILCSWRGSRSQLIERAFDLIVHIIKHIALHT